MLAPWLALLLCATAAGQSVAVRKDTVVVTGTYEPVPLEEADRSVHVMPVRGEQELLSNTVVDFLNRDSSVDLRQRAPNTIQADVSIRGASFGQTLVLVDGMRFSDAQSGHHNMNLPVPLESLDRIEVLKGSGSALYGADAVGGVLHFVTRPPQASEFRLRGAGGSFGVNQQRVALGLVRGRWAQQLAASRDFSTGFTGNRDYRNLALSSTTWLASGLGSTRVLLAHADRPFGAEQFYGNFNSWERTRAWFGALRQSLGRRTEASFAFRRHTDLFVLYRDRPQVFTNRHATESYQAALRRREPLGGNTSLHYGAEALRDSITSNNLGLHDRSRWAGYAALDTRALRRFSFTLGGRQEFYRSMERQFTGSMSGGMWLGGGWKLRASLSQAFRIPTYTDLYYHDPANQGSPDLRPERALGYEGGIDWHAGSRATLSAALFRRHERDGIDYVRRSPADLWRASNIHRLRFTGIETALRIKMPRGQAVDFSYTGLAAGQEQLRGLLSRYVMNYPRHNGIASWMGTMPGGWMARTRLGAIERRGRNAYALWDVYFARPGGRFRPFFQATNLGDARYEEITGVAMPGRALLGGMEIAVFSRGN